MGETKPLKGSQCSSYVVQLSSYLEHDALMTPMETTFMKVELLHGALTLYRFTSDRQAERFELSAGEVDALVAANRRRRSLVKRSQLERDIQFAGELPF